MPEFFGYKIPFNLKPNHGAHYGVPDRLLETRAKQHLQRMFDPTPDPRLQELFKQAHIAEQKALDIHTQLTFEKATKELIDQAEVVKTAAEAITDTAETVAKTAEKLLDKLEPPATTQSQALFSHLATASAAAFKAVPGKLCLLVTLPLLAYWYNQDNTLTNVTFNLKVAQKKIVQIKYGSNGSERCFEFQVAPGDKLRFPRRLAPADDTSAGQLPSNTNSASLFRKYILAPMTGYMLSRTTEWKEYHIAIEDPSFNPFLTAGPMIKSARISSDEILRFTHKSTYDYGLDYEQLKPDTAAFDLAADEVIEADSSEQLDHTLHIIVDVNDPPSLEENVYHEQLPNGEYITIRQKILSQY